MDLQMNWLEVLFISFLADFSAALAAHLVIHSSWWQRRYTQGRTEQLPMPSAPPPTQPIFPSWLPRLLSLLRMVGLFGSMATGIALLTVLFFQRGGPEWITGWLEEQGTLPAEIRKPFSITRRTPSYAMLTPILSTPKPPTVIIVSNRNLQTATPPVSPVPTFTLEAGVTTADEYAKQGSEYIRLKQYDLAVNAYTKAITLKKDDPTLYYGRGLAILQLSKEWHRPNVLWSAQRDFSQAIYLDLEDGTMDQPLSYFYSGITQYDLFSNYGWGSSNLLSAERDYTKYLDTNPDPSWAQEAHYQRGLVRMRMVPSNYGGAIEDFNAADQNDARVHAARGDAYREIGDYEAALKNYQKAIDIDPQLPSPYCGRALIYELLGEMKLSEENLKRYHELAPNAECK